MGRIRVSFQFPSGELRDGFEVEDLLTPEEVIQRLEERAGLDVDPEGAESRLYVRERTRFVPLIPHVPLRYQTRPVQDGAVLAVIFERVP